MQALADLGIDRGSRARHRPARLQGRDDLAARAAGRAALRRGPGRDPGGRGEAPADRVPDQGRALQLEGRRARAARGRQVRRQRRMEPQRRPAGRHLAAAGALRAFAGDGGARDRAAAGEAGHGLRQLGQPVPGAARVPRLQGKGARQAARHGDPPALLLLRLPAQHLDARARRQPRHRRHRLPLHGGVDGPQHRHLHAHGRRRRALDRAGAVHQREAHLRQPRRRHLLPLRPAGDPRRGGRQGQHDLQDPLQRRGGDDRRPAPRRPARPGDDLAPDRRRGREADRGRHRRAGEIPARHQLGARASPSATATSSMPCSANCAKSRACRR